MTRQEQGFLLLSSCLGEECRRPLTTAQLRTLARRVAESDRSVEDREITVRDFQNMGYSGEMADRILALLSEEDLLFRYLAKAQRYGCVPITRVSREYPPLLRQKLGLDSPGVLWVRGDLSLLCAPKVSLVGSRDIALPNAKFAEEAGRQAAIQGYALVSGNARGADRIAQEACLCNGGQVVCVLADSLTDKPLRKNVLYCSEDGFDLPFSTARALSRNRVIHAFSETVLVAQCGDGAGGTWHGTQANLKHGWSGVFCFRDGSAASSKLEQMGAVAIGIEDLAELHLLKKTQLDLFNS